jgi:DNA-binding PadR family transcriptional regulator
MRNFPWFWRNEGDAWEAMLHQGGPGGPPGGRHGGRHGDPRDRLRGAFRFGPGGPGEPDEPEGPPPGWGPFGRPPRGGPFGGAFFGFPPFGPGRRGRGWDWGGFGRGPKARRGDVRAAALVLLAEQPRNGYQIIQEIAERSGGMWKPSSGSVYPALQLLEDEGLVELEVQEGRRTFKLTEAGRTYVEEHKAELGAPWEAMSAGMDDSSTQIHQLLGQVAMATIQVAQAGGPAQLQQARQVLIDARRALYQILAEDEAERLD